MRIALDTNVLACAEGVGDERRCRPAIDWIERLPTDGVVRPTQTLGELTRVLIGIATRTPDQTRLAVLDWADSDEVADSTWRAFQSALDLVVDHESSMWDALVLAIAAESRCRLLLSEDLPHGFTWRGVTVVNPFFEPTHPLLQALMR